jgi:hypothetical protein
MASTIRDNDGNILSTEGPPAMFIDAYIRDDQGNLLFYLDELVESCFSKWVEIVKKYDLQA